MLRAVAALLAWAFATGQDPVGTAFHYRQSGKAVVSNRALGIDDDGLVVHVVVDCDLGWKLLKKNEWQVTPEAYRVEFKDKERVLELKDGKFRDSVEIGSHPGLTKPFTVTMSDSWKREKIETIGMPQTMLAVMLLDVLPTDSGALLGWFGPLQAGEKWTSTRKVMLAREDFLTLTATCVREPNGIKGTFKAAGRGWPENAVEESEGTVDLDAKGRVTSFKIAWSAKTKDGTFLASYKTRVELSESR